MSADVRIGVDLGGTKIEAIALDAAGVEVFRRRVATPKGDYDATVDAVRQLVEVAETAAGGRGRVGIGMPGAISPATGLVKNANSTWLIGRPLREDLARALARPVRLENDANCFALSEATDGAGAGARRRLRRDPRYRHWRRHRGRRAPDRRRATRSPASGDTTRCRGRAGRPARAGLLLRPARLHRDVPVGRRAW